ncbi:MAG: TlpA family protein disulfide reductase [Candidatus Marinimicrobia bacterium]|nr:TlpA family protein disulfide reductase [Candidatus Neomarinimicrobiota bacterium]MBT3998614.1 TlpA family protein disulfide reductase [Candidatus Neomarinimicrobiota bacterium]MBT4316960.1 TlpA family protein disulfide reductase [Candidatus Neomarinimicrobiota bacterium]MBT4925803.1 TlpA family protein disulfide reductase [Candidatus Neomarinimicrobiota bacterium]MBT6187871.1 TlpA family protein disulfide reductase [Candidatus Neomarinimicrobiota bacterium]
MSKNNLYIIIVLMVITLSYLSYEQYNLNQELEKWKGHYKSVAISYVKELMEAPELKAPTLEEMTTTVVDFDFNLLQFEDLEGSEFSLRDFKGKTLFINYWATWCNPCLAEMPSMVKLYEQYKDNEDIVFLYLSKESRDTIIDYIPKDEALAKLPLYKIITDDELFSTRGIPTTFIVDSSGEILVKDVGSAKWDDQSVINYIDNIL